mmetsp:Transcript_21138/g.66946  ORF Transcript_21138/g.66946 Transcript_21138/m.66946 type:complete len:203 (+) Transcript_21138:290-898(+)
MMRSSSRRRTQSGSPSRELASPRWAAAGGMKCDRGLIGPASLGFLASTRSPPPEVCEGCGFLRGRSRREKDFSVGVWAEGPALAPRGGTAWDGTPGWYIVCGPGCAPGTPPKLLSQRSAAPPGGWCDPSSPAARTSFPISWPGSSAMASSNGPACGCCFSPTSASSPDPSDPSESIITSSMAPSPAVGKPPSLGGMTEAFFM